MPAVTNLGSFFKYCVENKLPFAFYKLPNAKQISVVAQTNSTIHFIDSENLKSSTKGFLFAPFKETEQAKRILIKPELVCTDKTLPALNFAKPSKQKNVAAPIYKIKETSKASYYLLVAKLLAEITASKFKKVVLARVLKVARAKTFDAVTFFNALCNTYPHAFVSLVYTPFSGIWIGATPEVLLTLQGTNFKTYALAGTQEVKETKPRLWSKKEKEEQKIVSDYILNLLASIINYKPEIKGPLTIIAGKLFHLRTTFEYANMPHTKWVKIVNALHPTPAVAGVPTPQAIDFITQHETAPRQYYSGYLGPINLDKEIHLYVNLRCMHVLNKNLAIYVGGGITAESNAAAEWRETEIKSNTLLNVLKTKNINN